MNGHVSFFSKSKRYGFVLGEDGNSYMFTVRDLESIGLSDIGERTAVTFSPTVDDLHRRLASDLKEASKK